MTLLYNFKEEIKQAINSYLKQKQITELSKLPEHRKKPIKNIYHILANNELNWKQLKYEIKKELSTLDTGWLIATGRSTLKHKIYKVLNLKKYNDAEFLKIDLQFANMKIAALAAENNQRQIDSNNQMSPLKNKSLEIQLSKVKKNFENLTQEYNQLRNKYLDCKRKLEIAESSLHQNMASYPSVENSDEAKSYALTIYTPFKKERDQIPSNKINEEVPIFPLSELV